MRPAARLAGLGVSPIRVVSDGAPEDAIPLGLGEPTWELPEVARRALADYGGVASYGPQAGRPELRAAIADFHGTTPDRVLVTNGSQEALFDCAQAFLDPGDAALVPDPGFVGYPGVVRAAGGRPVPYRTAAGDRFRLDADAFTAALDATPDARLAILGYPANPTGGGATRDALARVAEACAARGVALVSDEVYRDLHFGTPVPSLLEVTDDAIVTSSVSKGFGAPGLRVGWLVAKEALLAPLRVVHGYAVTCASNPAQQAARALLEARDAVLPAARAEVAARFEALRAASAEHLGRAVEPPDGGFYHFLELPEVAWSDPLAWCLRLRDEAKVVLVPGLAFGEGGRRHARLSFAAKPEQVAEGVRRLAAFLAP